MSDTQLPADAPASQIEEELEVYDILLLSLDRGADDYIEQLARLEAEKTRLQDMLEETQSGAGWKKRSLPEPGLDSQRPSKRPTPQHSGDSTPAPSIEVAERHAPDSAFQKRQLAAEAALRRQREDEEYARMLSGQSYQSQPSSSQSYRAPGVQTTLNYNGTYQRHLPPPTAEPQRHSHPTPVPFPQTYGMPSVKTEPSLAQGQNSSRPHMNSQPTDVVDLTGSDDESSVPLRSRPLTMSDRSRAPMPNYPASQQQVRSLYAHQQYVSTPPAPQAHSGLGPSHSLYPQAKPSSQAYPYAPFGSLRYPGPMPGAFPSGSPPPGYSPAMHPSRSPLPHHGLLQGRANDGYRPNGHLGDPLAQLNGLFNGFSSRAQPVDITDDEDDDLVYSGSRRVLPQSLLQGRSSGVYGNHYPIDGHDPAKTQEAINALLENIRPDEELPEELRVQTPEAMAIRLHKYQELGLTWLKTCEEGTNKGGILADDMGLGKTIQMLSLMVTRKSSDPACKTTLIVAPVALTRQWKQEIEQKIKPGRHRLSVFIQHGQTKKKKFRDLQVYDVVITTYGSLASELKKRERFELRKKNDPDAVPSPSEQCALFGADCKWYRVILDEAQCIKNKSTLTSKAACMLKAKYRFCMTGTPMMNNVGELYSLIKFLDIAPYKQWEQFRLDFQPLFKAGATQAEWAKDRSMQKFQALCKAIMIRRTKTSKFEGQPILVLPERTTAVENPVFDDEQKAFYDAIETKSRLQFNRYLRNNQIGTQYSAILVLLLRLRQAACHPHLIKDFGVAAAADITEDQVLDFARELAEPIVARIKETEGNFECPVCYDAVPNPVIYIPCGHDSCRECFTRITDPETALRNGNENGGTARCPSCRGPIEAKRVTDFDAFKKVHMPELLTAEQQEELQKLREAEEENVTTDSDTDSETEDDLADDTDRNGNLRGFTVNDEQDDSTTEDEGEPGKKKEAAWLVEGAAGPSKTPKVTKESKEKAIRKTKAKGKGKGKEKEVVKDKKSKKTLTLADLKKLSTRSAKAKRAYLKRLRDTWVSSAKIDKTVELLQTIMDNPDDRERVLIFSQWTSLLDLLEVPIDDRGWGYRRYDGSMNSRMRGDAVDDFRDDNKNVRIMLVSLKAGNAGLNLNMASQVIILDPFWNPYIEEQAIDRAHRIGQVRPVRVHRMLIENTVEDRIIELQEQKRAMISEALDEKASQSISRLGARELAYLFGVTSDPSQSVPRQRRG